MKKRQDDKYFVTLLIFLLEDKLIRSRSLWYQCMRILANLSMSKSPHDSVLASGEDKMESS
jgi:hypothetical protein